ncbi:MAG: acetyl-CoA C-acetyltransferase [Chloroflexi bacterium]|nr:acetyl-CoA C-acetyltransferase [Chloroflexota bacterium]MBP7043655.1 acetyl-CoA C-acetyltransferase [Chloroflexota bacterium]
MSISQNPQDVVIVGAARTPTGRFMGGLSSLTATDLGATAVAAAIERSGIDPASVYEAIMGHVVQAGAGQAPARQAALRGGLPNTVGATAVNKVCGSGLKAVMMAANGIIAGEANIFVAGGMESMSNAPYLLPKARAGLRYGDAQLQDAVLHDGLWCAFQDWPMGNAAEFIAKQFNVSRQEMDQFSLRSHEKAAEATVNGRFAAEITPVEIKTRKTTTSLTIDEPIRASFSEGGYSLDTSLEQLAKLPAAFEQGGAVTAGNAPGLNDGAAALVLTSRAEAQRQGIRPLARIAGYTLAAVEPKWLFAAPASAMPRLLQRLDWTLDQVDLIELNEAFAAQALANGAEMVQKGYAWNWDKVNVNGGAVALGHPIGASGARVLVTLLYALQNRGLHRGIASLCLGGGEAVALAVEMENG